MKEFFASVPQRPTELERARMRKVLDAAPAPAKTRPVSDNSEVLVTELRAVRSEVASLREMLTELGQAPANDAILTRKQTAELLGMCIESISKLVRDEGMPCRRVGKEYRFLRSQVMAWLATRDAARFSGED